MLNNDAPTPLLWDSATAIDPDFRIKFRLLLSQNDLVGEKWQQTQRIEQWRDRGMARFIETAKAEKIPTEAFAERKEYIYRGKKKVKLLTGERLKEFMFREPIIIIVRLWLSDGVKFDIDNLHLKAVIDGFIDARMIPDDSVSYIPGVFRWFEGIDKTVALSPEEKEQRRRLSNQWKLQNINRRMPPPANKRIWIDCYRLSNLIEKKIDFFSLIGFPRLTF